MITFYWLSLWGCNINVIILKWREQKCSPDDILRIEGLRKEFGVLVPEVTVVAEYREQIISYDLSTAYKISASPLIRDQYEVNLSVPGFLNNSSENSPSLTLSRWLSTEPPFAFPIAMLSWYRTLHTWYFHSITFLLSEARYVYVSQSSVLGAGEGLMARTDIRRDISSILIDSL